MVSVAATKIQVLSPVERFEDQIFLRLLGVLHADDFLSLMSLSVLSILDPRYLKFLTCFRGSTLLAMSVPWLFTLNVIYPVFLAFICSPFLPHSAFTLKSSCWPVDQPSERSVISSVKSRSDIFSFLILLDLVGFMVRWPFLGYSQEQ